MKTEIEAKIQRKKSELIHILNQRLFPVAAF